MSSTPPATKKSNEKFRWVVNAKYHYRVTYKFDSAMKRKNKQITSFRVNTTHSRYAKTLSALFSDIGRLKIQNIYEFARFDTQKDAFEVITVEDNFHDILLAECQGTTVKAIFEEIAKTN